MRWREGGRGGAAPKANRSRRSLCHEGVEWKKASKEEESMLLLDCNAERDALSHLLEAGTEVNAAPGAFAQSPAHLAARGGHAFFLLWQLQTGANLNQQDWLGEAPIHKAAKVGSLECLTLLVASHASIELRNKNGQTAEDLASAFGFLECAQFLMSVKHIQTRKTVTQINYSLHDNDDCTLGDAARRQKRACESKRPVSKKRVRSNDMKSLMPWENQSP